MKMPVVVAILALALSVAPAWAQQSGAIVGQVRDTTGAVLPGVTVEVSSPTLIEKVRSSVSDGGGLYRIIDLPAGTYRVTFGLAGFSTVRREGITLTVNFTATVNADLAVGSVEETVTVTGASPIVDVRNAVQQTVLSREVLDVIPIGKQYTSAGTVIPGMLVRASTSRAQFDVGGGAGWDGQYLMIHGSRQIDQVLLLDGLPSQHFDGAAIAIAPSDGSVQEQAIEAGAHMAEAETGGVYINVFHKSGGNTFHGAVPFSFTNDKLQSKNVTADQVAIGVPPTNGNNYLMDLNPSFGGPIRRDRLWFNASVRTSRVSRQSGTYYDTDSTDWAYIPDRSRGSVPDVRPQDDMTVRLTWQATARHQISVNTQYGQAVRCCQFMAGNRTFDASTKTTNVGKPMLHGTWTFPVTDHVLMEAGAEAFFMQLNPAPTGNAIFPAALEQNGGWEFRSTFARGNQVYNSTKYYSFFSRFALKYVTGSHAFKVGVSLWPQREHLTYYGNGYYSVTLLNTVPTFVTYLPEPREPADAHLRSAPRHDGRRISRYAPPGNGDTTRTRLPGGRRDAMARSVPPVRLRV